MASAKTTKTNRVFIDSSVLIAAAIYNKGAARDLLRQGFRGQVDLYISTDVLVETKRNLALKAPEALADFHIFRELLLAKLVDPPKRLISSAAKLVPLKDAPTVAAA
jgi:predicted nucleic acid-binding protein